MAFCKHRVMDKCKKDNRPCIFSKECCEPEEKKMTNADRIRNMTDEELAEFLDKSLNLDREDCDPIGCYGCAYYGTHHQDKDGGFYECGDCEFEGGLLQWLQAEVKEGNSDAS